MFFRLALGISLACAGAVAVKSVVLAGPAAPIGPAYTTEKIQDMLSSPVLPTGLHLIDKQQAFANVANAMNTNGNAQQNSHTGYSVELYEPAAWLGKKRATASKEFKTFGIEDVDDRDRLPALRVHVSPDTPFVVTAAGTRNSHSVEHVVLRSVDKLVVVQPVSIEETTSPVQNGFGAKLLYTGATAMFSLEDLEKVRAGSPEREFFVTIVGQGRGANRDFRVKQKHFQMLGD